MGIEMHGSADHPGSVSHQGTTEGAMHAVILPDTFLTLLGAFECCFHAPSYRNFVTLITGWVHCLGR